MVVTKYFTNNKGEIDKVVNEFLREEKNFTYGFNFHSVSGGRCIRLYFFSL